MDRATPWEPDGVGGRHPDAPPVLIGMVNPDVPDDLPAFLEPLQNVARTISARDFGALVPPQGGGRRAAVLLLFWQEHGETYVLLIERSTELRSHAGQPAFPGGAVDDTDAGPAAAAVRETVEETGLDPAGVEVFATLPDLWVPVSSFLVTPVLAWWRRPSPVSVVDPVEVAAVHKVKVEELVDPANRVTVKHTPSGRTSPGFRVNGILVWGFTAAILDRVLRHAGWERPWPVDRVEELSPEVIALGNKAERDLIDETPADGAIADGAS